MIFSEKYTKHSLVHIGIHMAIPWLGLGSWYFYVLIYKSKTLSFSQNKM
jgi:hypothetical protein